MVMHEPSRPAPPRRSAASFDRGTLTIPHGATLPKVCFGCGKDKVKCAVRNHEVVSPGLGVAVMFLSTFVGLRLWVTGTVTLHYALCEPCRRRTMDADQARQALAIGGVVVAIGFATAVFNGARLATATIAVIGPGLIYAVYTRFVRDRQLVVIETSPRVRIRDVHSKAVEAVLEALRLPEEDA